jgi:hypothetical protein
MRGEAKRKESGRAQESQYRDLRMSGKSVYSRTRYASPSLLVINVRNRSIFFQVHVQPVKISYSLF